MYVLEYTTRLIPILNYTLIHGHTWMGRYITCMYQRTPTLKRHAPLWSGISYFYSLSSVHRTTVIISYSTSLVLQYHRQQIPKQVVTAKIGITGLLFQKTSIISRTLFYYYTVNKLLQVW